MKYRLGDLTVTHWNDWDRVPRMPEAVGTWLLTTFFGSAGAALSTATFLGVTGAYAVGYLAITAVTSWALSALAPRPDFSSFGSQSTLVNTRDAVAPADFVYGEVRKGGNATYYESTGEKNKFLHQIIVLAGHEVDAIGDIYLNDEIVTLDANGFVTDEAWSTTSTERVVVGFREAGEAGRQPIYENQETVSKKIRIFKHDGSQTSTADTFANSATESMNSTLLAESELTGSDALDTRFVGNGISFLYVRYEHDQTVFASGLPLVTAIINGKKVYDPRTGITAYSNNAALCIRDFITSEYGLNDSAVDDVVFSAAANESDELVSLSGVGTEKRYTINGIVKSSSPIGDVLGKMSTACAGTLFWGSGYWKLKVGAYSAPVKTLTLDDLRGPINLNTRTTMRDSFNGVTGTFNDASAKFITADYPPIKSSIFQAEDGGDELLLDLPLPFTTSAATAQRIAKMTLFRSREQMSISADFGLEAFDVEVGDIIAFTNERYGFDAKEFEVMGWKFASSQDAGDLRVTLTLQETSAAAFEWDAEESDIIGNNTNLPSAGAGLAINNLVAYGGGRTQGDGTFINSVILDWDDVTSSFLSYYEVQWKPLSDSSYSSTTIEFSDIELSPLIDGVEYIIRVRAVSVSGATGEYATVTFTGGGDVTAPALPTSITATGHFEYITIDWTNPADADLNYVEVYENTSNSTVGATKVGISGGDSFQRTNLGLNETRWYFLKAVDYSGNASDFTAGVSATTTYLDDAAFANGIYSLFTEQGLYAIEDVTSLPSSGDFTGQKVFNRTDGKLYQWAGSSWELVIAEPDSFIASDKIIANTITGGLLETSGIITNSAQINDTVISRAKIEDAAISTAKIGDNMVTFPLAVINTTSTDLTTSSGLTTLATLTATRTGAPAQIVASCSAVSAVGAGTSGYGRFDWELWRGSTRVRSFTNAKVQGETSPTMSIYYTDTISTTSTYYLKADVTLLSSATAVRFLLPSITFIELKK